jgi:5'-3' exonuclease
MPDNILAIDGHNFLHRANVRFSHTPAATRSSLTADYTMVYNFFRNLRAEVEKFKPQKIFFVLEGHPKHRYELLSSYKENRRIKLASSEEAQTSRTKFFEDADICVKLMKHLPITTARHPDYECDDVVASLARSMPADNFTVLSNDTDYIQLLQDESLPNLKVYSPTKKEFMAPPDYHYLTWKSLAGDKSDNVKGLMGDKRAQTLCTKPHLLEQFLAVQENLDGFLLNKKVIEFANVPDEELEISDGIQDYDPLYSEFEKMDMPTIIEMKYWAKFRSTFSCVQF